MARLLPLDGLSAALRIAVAFVLVFVASAFAGGFVAWLVKKMVAAPANQIAMRAFVVIYLG